MRLTRVHVESPLRSGTRIALPESAAAHLTRVLRLREGDACVLFDGDGREYEAVLTAVGKRGVEAEVGAAREVENESPLRILLLQGIARGEKMDLILQKATELGVAAVQPVFAERTEVRLDGERLDKRMAHWRSVVVSACEQSGRARLPTLHDAAALADAARALPARTMKLTLDPQGEHRFGTLPAPARDDAAQASQRIDIVLAIGPEGGFSPKDRLVLGEAGFQGLRLGPRVLRTETAGLAAIAALQARFGDW